MLDNIVNKYNNTVHRTTKMKPINVTSDSYVEYNEDSNKKDPKFKVVDQNWSEEVFVIIKIINTVPWTHVISDLNGEPVTGAFFEKELQKTNQEKSRTEKLIEKKGNKLYVKWKGYNNSFNSWINKKDIV